MRQDVSIGVAGERFEGDFETHLTVACDDDQGVVRLDAWAREAGVKFTHVVLARGRVRSQPMLTLTGSGTAAEQLSTAANVVSDLERAGFSVPRVKVEATPWTRGVPRTDADAQALGPRFYFEHHVKILCDADMDAAELEILAALVSPHRAHLSWNARRVRGDGRAERFVTQRCFQVGNATAEAALDVLRAALVGDVREIVALEREFVVYDSDASLDDGWIDEMRERVSR
jgi:hypothetical protein